MTMHLFFVKIQQKIKYNFLIVRLIELRSKGYPTENDYHTIYKIEFYEHNFIILFCVIKYCQNIHILSSELFILQWSINIKHFQFQLLMDQQAVFQIQINNQQTDIQQEIVQIPLCNPYLKRGDSSKYIDQFLQKTPLSEQKFNQQNQITKVSVKIQQHPHQESISVGAQNLANIEHQEDQPTSIFHNFQKHLSIYLKRHMKQIKKVQMTDAQIICQKLKRAFMDSTVNSKKLILFIFGQQSFKGRQKTLKQYGVKQIYSKYNAQDIRKGKELLREQTLKQLQDVDVKSYLSGTRIKNKQYFVLYVKNFMNQLKDGIFRKRIKKQGVIQN